MLSEALVSQVGLGRQLSSSCNHRSNITIVTKVCCNSYVIECGSRAGTMIALDFALLRVCQPDHVGNDLTRYCLLIAKAIARHSKCFDTKRCKIHQNERNHLWPEWNRILANKTGRKPRTTILLLRFHEYSI